MEPAPEPVPEAEPAPEEVPVPQAAPQPIPQPAPEEVPEAAQPVPQPVPQPEPQVAPQPAPQPERKGQFANSQKGNVPIHQADRPLGREKSSAEHARVISSLSAEHPNPMPDAEFRKLAEVIQPLWQISDRYNLSLPLINFVLFGPQVFFFV